MRPSTAPDRPESPINRKDKNKDSLNLNKKKAR